ncbi:MAG: hypothetical protein AAFV98_03740 [Chloroflexota bacterium]
MLGNIVLVFIKISVTWLAIISLVTLISPQTVWQIRVLWGRLRGTLDTFPDAPPAWLRQARLLSALVLPMCTVLLVYWVRALPIF